MSLFQDILASDVPYNDELTLLPPYLEPTSLPIVTGGTSTIATYHDLDASQHDGPDAVGILPVRTLPPIYTASPILSTAPIDAIGSIPDRTLSPTSLQAASASPVSVPTVPATSTDVLTQIMTPVSTSITGGTAATTIVQPPPHHTALFWAVILAVLYFLFRS